MMIQPVKRCDIVLYDFGTEIGSVQGGIRPAVVVQTDTQNTSSPTTIVAPLTKKLKKVEMPSHVVLGKRFGLRHNSMVLLEQIKTVNQDAIIRLLGHIDDPLVVSLISLGLRRTLAIPTRVIGSKSLFINKNGNLTAVYDERDVMCLCPICCNAYRNRGFEIIAIGGSSGTCDYCNYRVGFDYAVVGILTNKEI